MAAPGLSRTALGQNGPVNPGVWTEDQDHVAVWPGQHQPLGATWAEEATNFAVYAPEATRVEVCLFDDGGAGGEVERRYVLTEYTLGIWHGAIPGVPKGQRYGFRADGPWDPTNGLRFNPHKLLLDPYALAVSGSVVPGPEIFGYVPYWDLDATIDYGAITTVAYFGLQARSDGRLAPDSLGQPCTPQMALYGDRRRERVHVGRRWRGHQLSFRGS